MPDFIFPDAKTFRDPIYGLIKVPEFLLKIVDDPLFQRLRWISQMSLAQMVYPGAVHTRFEHSLGTMHLAYIASLSIWNDAERNRRTSKACADFLDHIENKENFVKAAMTVGLLHDVGHAPFSHVFEMAVDEYDHEEVGYFVSQHLLRESELSGEKWAIWVLEALNKEKDLAEISPPAQVLRTMIDGKGIDIDKGDYLLRDSHHCGVSYGHYGWERIWNNLTVIYDEKDNKEILKVAITPKAAYEAYHLSVARFHMYEAVYEHHTKQKIDAVIGGLLRKTPGVLSPSLRQIKESPQFMLCWSDGYVIFKLIDSFSGEIIENIYKRILPSKVEFLEEICIVLPENKFEKKRIKKELKEKVWYLAKKADLFPYFYRPQEPFPLEALYEVKVKLPNSDDTKPLFHALEIRNVKAVEATQDPEESPRSLHIRVRPYAYDIEQLRSYQEEWEEIRQMGSYRSLLQ